MGSSFSSKRCDVFVSFRGEDTRNNFTGHLCSALEKAKIRTYADEEMRKGDEISPALLKAIKRAKVSVVVFSENYASSSWCLDELVHILKCKHKRGQIVVPVFYRVDPSDVRKQKGGFSETNFSGDKRKVRAWSDALKTAANLAGWDSQTIRSEAKLIEEIVKDVKNKLDDLRKRAEEAAVIAAMTATMTVAPAC